MERRFRELALPGDPPKKSCVVDRARNSVARAAVRIRTDHWRSAVFLHRTRRCANDLCWFCRQMTRSHVLLHCNGDRLAAARTLAWEGHRLPNIRVLLANPRWEARLFCFLESSGVGRVVGKVDAEEEWVARTDGCVVWEAEERVAEVSG